MSTRRFTRLTNAFSKKFDNHRHALALYFTYYNFVRVHASLKCSPAMAAGVTATLWAMKDLAATVDADAPKPGPRRPCKKTQAA
jgi:hypothetical protein